jgi:hypothetical protein
VPAADLQLLCPLRLAVLIDLRQREWVIPVEAVQLVGRVDVLTVWAIDIGDVEPGPFALDLAIRLHLNADNILIA